MTPKHNFNPGDIAQIHFSINHDYDLKWVRIINRDAHITDEYKVFMNGKIHTRSISAIFLRLIHNPSRFELVLNGLED